MQKIYILIRYIVAVEVIQMSENEEKYKDVGEEDDEILTDLCPLCGSVIDTRITPGPPGENFECLRCRLYSVSAYTIDKEKGVIEMEVYIGVNRFGTVIAKRNSRTGLFELNDKLDNEVLERFLCRYALYEWNKAHREDGKTYYEDKVTCPTCGTIYFVDFCYPISEHPREEQIKKSICPECGKRF